MKSLKQTLIIVLIAAGLIFTAMILNDWYDHQVRQKVVENEHDCYDSPYLNLQPIFMYSVKTDTATINRYYEQYEIMRKEHERKFYAKFKLITSYNHHEVVDYGTAEQIDSVKCLRYHEMVFAKVIYDEQDLKMKTLKKNIEQAEEAAEDAKKELLEKLNKSCN